MVTLLDFTARYCGPCKALTPILAALEAEYAGHVRVVVVDVDAEPMLAQQYLVRSTPTLVLTRDDREVGRAVGARPRSFIAGMLDRALNGDVAITAP